MAWFRRGGLRAGRPVVCRMARNLPDRGTKFLSRLDRLESHLNQADDLDQKVKVRLPGRDKTLTMVVARSPGNDVPFMLLTSLPVESVEDARRVLAYYARRWECEEGIRFLKSEVSLERIRTFSWTAICRLVLLCVLVMLYLSWMLERKPNLAERLIAFGQPLPDEPDFLLYRMLTGLTEAITACIYAGRDLL